MITDQHLKLINQCNPNHFPKDTRKVFDQLADKKIFTDKYKFKATSEILSLKINNQNNQISTACDNGDILTFESETGKLLNQFKIKDGK